MMGRGLGKTQKMILETLMKKGAPQFVSELAFDLYNADKEPSDWYDWPPRSFKVSVRRAVHSLAKRKKVHCGYSRVERRLPGDPDPKLMCWLPDHMPPKLRAIAKGEKVDKVVLAVLQSVPTLEGPAYRNLEYYKRYKCSKYGPCWEDDLVPYNWMVNQVLNVIDPGIGGWWSSPAIHRSVKRLSKSGKIKARWYKMGRYGWIGAV